MEYPVVLKNLSKRFLSPRDPRQLCIAVDRVTLELKPEEFLAMAGPRGCGKSTILRMIAGLEQPTEGDIFVDGRRVNGLPPRARNIGFMLQSHALFSHMSAADNIAFGLKVRNTPKKERQGGLKRWWC